MPCPARSVWTECADARYFSADIGDETMRAGGGDPIGQAAVGRHFFEGVRVGFTFGKDVTEDIVDLFEIFQAGFSEGEKGWWLVVGG